MFITTRKHRAIVARIEEERAALSTRADMLAMTNTKLELELFDLHTFIESEGLHQKHCDSFNNKPCDCRLARAGRANAG